VPDGRERPFLLASESRFLYPDKRLACERPWPWFELGAWPRKERAPYLPDAEQGMGFRGVHARV